MGELEGTRHAAHLPMLHVAAAAVVAPGERPQDVGLLHLADELLDDGDALGGRPHRVATVGVLVRDGGGERQVQHSPSLRF